MKEKASSQLLLHLVSIMFSGILCYSRMFCYLYKEKTPEELLSYRSPTNSEKHYDSNDVYSKTLRISVKFSLDYSPKLQRETFLVVFLSCCLFLP